VRDHDHDAKPKPSRPKNQTEKRPPAWYAKVRREAREALARARERDRLWREKREEQRRAGGVS
jgi:hypothetical protein